MVTSDLYHDSDALVWLDLLLSPFLKELNVKPISKSHTAWFSYLATSAILEKVVNTCSMINKIEVYPIDITRGDDGKGSDLTTRLWPTHLLQSFGALAQLREITSSILILSEGGLVALGALPRLQILSIYGCGERPTGLPLAVTDDSFPALTELSLLCVDTTSLSVIMDVIPLVRRITSFSLSPTFRDSEWGETRGRWLSQILHRLLKHTYCLKRFSYDTDQSNEHYSHGTYSINYTSLLRAMSSLPLRYVSLLGLFFTEKGFLVEMAAAWPLVTELRLPDQPVANDDLHWFARIPNLRHLVLQLSFYELPPVWSCFEAPLETLESTLSRVGNQRFGGSDGPVSAYQASR
jgi:hypothetical protein